MNAFAVAKTFQAKPSNLKKKVALAAFIVGAISFTLAITKIIGTNNGAYFFAGGITAMALSFRFWSMQVHNPTAVTFAENGVTIAQGSSSETIAWAELESIRYKVWRGGHFWEFKKRDRKSTFDFYVDGLSAAQRIELSNAVSSVKTPGATIQTDYNPLESKGELVFAAADAVRRATQSR